MRIGIDYRLAVNSNRGMGRYIREIVRELQHLDNVNEYILYIDANTSESNLQLPNNFKLKELGRANYILFEQVLLPRQANSDRVDILWCPSNTFPLILKKNIKLVVTIHDLIFMDKSIKNPTSLYQLIGRQYRKYCLLIGKKRIDHVFTVSQYSKKDIEQKLRLKDITITYNRVDNFKKLLDDEYKKTDILNKLGIESKEYFYTVSGDAPSKNLSTSIKVFESSDIREKIVISGIKDYKKAPFYKYILDKKLQDKIIFSGYITDSEMIDLYQNSKGFLFLSLSEGFGIPLLEAMFFNLPIISSNSSCLPEILGNGGGLVNPLDVQEIKERIRSIDIYNDKKYQVAREEQIRKFISWEQSAKIVAGSFENLLNNN